MMHGPIHIRLKSYLLIECEGHRLRIIENPVKNIGPNEE